MSEEIIKEGNPLLDTSQLIVNLMVLDVLWIICCIPIVTLGASTAALNYTCIKLQRDEGESVIRMFFRSFVSNVRQGLILGTGFEAALIIITACLIQTIGSINSGHGISVLFAVALVLLLFLWITAFTYVCMVLARFDNTLLRTITNAVYFMSQNLFRTVRVFGVLCGGLMIVPYIFWTFIPALFPLVIFFGVPSVAYLVAGVFNRDIFSEYVDKTSRQ